jgi:hypothetical protein
MAAQQRSLKLLVPRPAEKRNGLALVAEASPLS